MTDLPLHERLAKLEARTSALEADRLHVTDVERLEVGPDDVLFVHLREDVTKAEMDDAARVIAETLGTRRVLMLAGDMRVSVAPLPDATRDPSPFSCCDLPLGHAGDCMHETPDA